MSKFTDWLGAGSSCDHVYTFNRAHLVVTVASCAIVLSAPSFSANAQQQTPPTGSDPVAVEASPAAPDPQTSSPAPPAAVTTSPPADAAVVPEATPPKAIAVDPAPTTTTPPAAAATPPPAATAPQVSEPSKPSVAPSTTDKTLPTVTIETGDDEKPAAAPAKKTQKPPVVVEDASPPPPPPTIKKLKPAKQAQAPKPKPAQASKPKPVAAPTSAETESSSDGSDTSDAVTNSEVTLDAAPSSTTILGGPSGIDGYTAKQTTTATKTGTPIKNIPQAISVVTKQEATDRGSVSLGQALTYVPGVNVAQGEGHRDQITVRGQQTTADFFVNGVRDDIEYYRDLYNVDSVEVLKGPSAMVFGRGGGGGVVNRSTKAADGRTVRDVSVTGGMYDTKRATVDVGQALSSTAAFRLNAMFEDSENFRDFFELQRFGINPTMSFNLSDQTKLLVSYEYYNDDRVVDRGVPSLNGRPSDGRKETFFGAPAVNQSDFAGHTASLTLEHKFSEDLKVRSHSSFADGDKSYTNTFANSAVSAAGKVRLSGYADETLRQSFVNQTDLTYKFKIADDIQHTLLFGTEVTHQETENNRDLARFNTLAGPGSLTVPFANPTISTPVFFNNPNRRRNTELETYSAYIQDQFQISRYVELIGGLRFDRFDIDFENGLTGESFTRVDDVWSPRAGIVFKPSEQISIYGSYSRSFLPAAGDQFNVLTVTTSTLEPEEFENKEIGFKWEVLPRLTFSGALFQLDRGNQVVASGPLAGQQVGETRTDGGELALTGYVTDAWQVSASFAHQIAEVSVGRPEDIGKEVPWVPHNTFALWNKYQFTPVWAAGVGVVHKTSFFAELNNNVEVPGYTRVDAALFATFDETWSAQLNVENLFDTDYFASAHNNNNIMPGAPTSVFMTVNAKF